MKVSSVARIKVFALLLAAAVCSAALVVPEAALANALFAPQGANFQMHRLYNPNSGEHFYTSNVGERDHLVSVGWTYEGVGWIAPAAGKDVYRLYNAYAGDHHYTTDVVEKDSLVRVGWRYEGVGWKSGGSVPLYRQYNPNAEAGSHNYTTNKGENDMLVSVGWRAEGIGWYGLGARDLSSGSSPKSSTGSSPSASSAPELSQDSDGDGVSDWAEATCLGTDPRSFTDFQNSDLEGQTRFADGVRSETKDVALLSNDASGIAVCVSGEKTSDYSVGEVVVFESESGGTSAFAVKVENVTVDDHGNTIVQGIVPELGETYSSINEEGEFVPDIDGIVLGEGLVLAGDDTGSDEMGQGDLLPQENANSEVKITSKDGKIEFALNVKQDDLTVEGNVSLEPDGQFKVNAVPSPVPVLTGPLLVTYMNADYTFDIEESLSVEVSKDKEITLADIPLPGAGALQCGGYVEVKLKFSVEGSVEVTTSFTQSLRAEYKMMGGMSVNSSTSNMSDPAVKAQVKGKAGIKLYPTFKMAAIELLSAGADTGFTLKGTGTIHNNPKMTCVDVSFSWYLSAFGEALGGVTDKLKVTKEIFNDKNSPLSFKAHWEDGIRVDECTWHEGGCRY